jgi:hypothetical protein
MNDGNNKRVVINAIKNQCSGSPGIVYDDVEGTLTIFTKKPFEFDYNIEGTCLILSPRVTKAPKKTLLPPIHRTRTSTYFLSLVLIVASFILAGPLYSGLVAIASVVVSGFEFWATDGGSPEVPHKNVIDGKFECCVSSITLTEGSLHIVTPDILNHDKLSLTLEGNSSFFFCTGDTTLYQNIKIDSSSSGIVCGGREEARLNVIDMDIHTKEGGVTGFTISKYLGLMVDQPPKREVRLALNEGCTYRPIGEIPETGVFIVMGGTQKTT